MIEACHRYEWDPSRVAGLQVSDEPLPLIGEEILKNYTEKAKANLGYLRCNESVAL